VDYFTRWPEARAVPQASAHQAAKFIYEEIICRHGIVDVIHSDQGTHFVNDLITKLVQKFDMKHHKITAYHPQANGLVERFNGTLKQTLAKISEGQEDWDDFIAPALFAHRSSPVRTIGVAPSVLEYGRNLRLPLEIQPSMTIWERVQHMVTQVPIFREQAIAKIKQSHQEMKQRDNVRQCDFKKGQQVLLKKETFSPWKKGLEPKWEGPFEIAEVLSHGTYRIKNHIGVQAKPINGDRLKGYKDRLFMEPIIVIEN
jgi:hypothetical protein